jgi:hypothetical protein
VDHLMHSNELLLHHRILGADLHNGLRTSSTASCDCSYIFDFTFDPSVSTPYRPRTSNQNRPRPGVFSRLTHR